MTEPIALINAKLIDSIAQIIEDIWVFLTQQDELLADKQIAQILDRFPMLSQFPNMGKQRKVYGKYTD